METERERVCVKKSWFLGCSCYTDCKLRLSNTRGWEGDDKVELVSKMFPRHCTHFSYARRWVGGEGGGDGHADSLLLQ